MWAEEQDHTPRSHQHHHTPDGKETIRSSEAIFKSEDDPTDRKQLESYPSVFATAPAIAQKAGETSKEKMEASSGEDRKEELIHRLFHIPEYPSKPYKESIRSIIGCLRGMEDFTDDLEQKVDHLLRLQESEFVTSYTAHMKRVRKEFKDLAEEVSKQQQLIRYYENEGKMSDLVKKVARLEEESKRLYGILEGRDRDLKGVRMELKVQKEENKRMHLQIKDLMKNKAEDHAETRSANKSGLQKQMDKDTISLVSNAGTTKNQKMKAALNLIDSELKFFNRDHSPSGQLMEEKSLKRDASSTTEDKYNTLHRLDGRSFDLSENSNQCGGSPDGASEAEEDEGSRSRPHRHEQKMHRGALQRKLQQLTTKNKELTQISHKMLSSRGELEGLFIDAVNQIKKNIRMRRKIRECSFEDFRKEDKLNLLVMIISNDEILKAVYERLFQGQRSGQKAQAEEPRQYLSTTNSNMHRQQSVIGKIASIHISAEEGKKLQSVNSIKLTENLLAVGSSERKGEGHSMTLPQIRR